MHVTNKMNNKNKVLLVGEANSNNLGDSVICKVGYEIFSGIYDSNVCLFDISMAKRFLFRHNICRKMLKIACLYHTFEYICIYIILFLKYKNIKKVIFLGGALVNDYFINAINPILRFAYIERIPVRFLSIGYENLSEKSLGAFKKHVSLIDDILMSTRDNPLYLEKIFNNRIKKTPDVAILTSQVYNILPNKTGVIGLGCINPEIYKQKERNPGCSKKYVKDMVDTIEKLCLLGYRIELFTNGDPKDYEWAQTIFKQSANSNLSLASRPLTDVDLVECIAKYDKIISARLHSLIIAYSFGIPSYCVAWSHKIIDFAELTENSNVIDMAEINCVDWRIVLPTLEINDELRKNLKDDILKYVRAL